MLTDLRKLANHCMNVRALFSDEVVLEIATRLVQLDDHYHKEYGAQNASVAIYNAKSNDKISSKFEMLVADLKLNSDYELNELCDSYSYLRKFCAPRSLFYTESAKLQKLGDVLRACRAARQKALIFSQFTKTLDMIEHFCRAQREAEEEEEATARGGSYWPVTRLDGSTAVKERQLLIDAYTKDENGNAE